MHLSTQRKISFGTLALAVVAFATDRLVFTPAGAEGQPPQPAALVHTSGPANPSSARTAEATPASQEADARLAALSVVAQRLQRAAHDGGLNAAQAPDAFEPASWIGPAPAKVNAAPDAGAILGRFRQRHKVLAVMKSGRGAMALVDGRTLRRGQVIDGFKLTQVRERSVVFESSDGQVELFVAGATAVGDAADNLEIVPSQGREQETR
jgi:hypothetical protein